MTKSYKCFLDEVVAPLVKKGEKLLVFTEYRGTQTYLKEALEGQFPEVGEIELINGLNEIGRETGGH